MPGAAPDETLETAAAVDPGRTSMFAALRYRDYRLFWIGHTVSNTGTWMEMLAQGWLVVQLAIRDGSPQLAPFYLGLVGLARAVPGLGLSLVAGAVVGCHGQDLYKKEKKVHPPQEMHWAGDAAAVESGRILGESVNFARRLVNEPPSRIFPASFAEEAASVVGIGAFAENTLVHAGQCTKVDPAARPAVVALLGCGVMAGAGAALNTAQVSRGDSVAVIGCGGVGDGSIMGARLAGASRIIAVDTDPTKLKWAEEFGATHAVNAAREDPVARIQNLDLFTWMRGDILVKADKMNMANSLELRVPFLDKEVFKVAQTIPFDQKIAHGTTKYALRKAEEMYARAVELDPSFARGHVALGHVYNLEKKLDDGLREFEQALKVDPKSFAAISALAAVTTLSCSPGWWGRPGWSMRRTIATFSTTS